jgi:hypothetical protein
MKIITQEDIKVYPTLIVESRLDGCFFIQFVEGETGAPQKAVKINLWRSEWTPVLLFIMFF